MEDQYTYVKNIDRGAYSVVNMYRDTRTNELVAVKEIVITDQNEAVKKIPICNPNDADEGVPSNIIREASLFRAMEHENILRLLDVRHKLDILPGETIVYLVFELLDLDLRKFMIRSYFETPEKPRLIKNFLQQILHGVNYFHSQKILHRDLKPENVLIDLSNKRVKIADFGLARLIGVPPPTLTDIEGSLWYKAPELLLDFDKYSFPIDIWSVGCIFAEMVMEKPLFQGGNTRSQLSKIFSVLGRPSESVLGRPSATTRPGVRKFKSPSLADFEELSPQDLTAEVPGLELAGYDLLSKMLSLDPSQRVTAHEALEHAYFNDV